MLSLTSRMLKLPVETHDPLSADVGLERRSAWSVKSPPRSLKAACPLIVPPSVTWFAARIETDPAKPLPAAASVHGRAGIEDHVAGGRRQLHVAARGILEQIEDRNARTGRIDQGTRAELDIASGRGETTLPEAPG